jgi:thiol-disulfide isomerase/thioredoxin
MRILIAGLVFAGLAAAQPKLMAVDEAGYPKLIAASKGKVVLVDFWATWCKGCRAEMPELVKLALKLKARGFELVTISADETEQEAGAARVLKENNVAGVWYIKRPKDDDKFLNATHPKWAGELPAMFLYDRTGKKVRAFIGETPSKELESAIEKLL